MRREIKKKPDNDAVKHRFAMGLGMPAWANSPAGSTGVDLTPLTNAVNFSTVSISIFAIADTLMTLYAAYAGVRFIIAHGQKHLINGEGAATPIFMSMLDWNMPGFIWGLLCAWAVIQGLNG